MSLFFRCIWRILVTALFLVYVLSYFTLSPFIQSIVVLSCPRALFLSSLLLLSINHQLSCQFSSSSFLRVFNIVVHTWLQCRRLHKLQLCEVRVLPSSFCLLFEFVQACMQIVWLSPPSVHHNLEHINTRDCTLFNHTKQNK